MAKFKINDEVVETDPDADPFIHLLVEDGEAEEVDEDTPVTKKDDDARPI